MKAAQAVGDDAASRARQAVAKMPAFKLHVAPQNTGARLAMSGSRLRPQITVGRLIMPPAASGSSGRNLHVGGTAISPDDFTGMFQLSL